MTDSSIRDKHDKWTVLIPISHLELDASVNYEFKIDRMILVSTNKLSGRRRRLGLPPRLFEVRKKFLYIDRFLNLSPVVGIVRISGTMGDRESDVVTLVREELAILTASQLGYAKRHQTAAPAILNERPETRQSFLWLGSAGESVQPNRYYGPFGSLRVDWAWLRYQKDLYFNGLLRLIRKDGRAIIENAWRQDLRRAAVLIGLSHAASSLSDAFLWNMIALELLTTRSGDKVGDALPARAEALLGWSQDWEQKDFESKIRAVYQRRCQLVHQGDRDCPTREDLYFTDDLLLCLLTNLVGHPALFRSKEDVIEFSKRVAAERLLGVKQRVRPKSLRMIRREYDPRDYEIY